METMLSISAGRKISRAECDAQTDADCTLHSLARSRCRRQICASDFQSMRLKIAVSVVRSRPWAPFYHSSADSQVEREDSPFRHAAAGVLLHAPRRAQKTHEEKSSEAGLSLVRACLNQRVNRRGDARAPRVKGAAADPRCTEKLLLISARARMRAC
jgi:hypothetical protein